MGHPPADRRWLAALYDRMGASLYRHALMILLDPALAEDAVQQAFLKLLSRTASGPIAQVDHYLRCAARNESFRLLARRPPAAGPEAMHQVPSRLLEPLDAACREEMRLDLQRALAQLPPEQREVIHLKVFEQMTFADVAALLNVSINTAASRYRYATAKLQDLLARFQEAP